MVKHSYSISMPTLRLSVWSPLRHHRELQYLASGSVESGSEILKDELLFSHERLAEEVYSWAPDENIWGGFADEKVRQELRQEFLSAFNPSLPPGQRSLKQFAEFVDRMNGVLSKGGVAEWMNTIHPIQESPGKEILFRVSPTLALVIHLQWILDTFRDVPGLSITVR
jgi:hypothetical protein